MNYRNRGLVVLACLVAGCATITKGTDQAVVVDTPGHAGAVCTLTSEAIGTQTITTPATVTLKKSGKDIAVVCKKDCLTGTGTITSVVDGMTAGNILVGGVIGLGVDAASGALNKYAPSIMVTMVNSPSCGQAAPLPAPRVK